MVKAHSEYKNDVNDAHIPLPCRVEPYQNFCSLNEAIYISIFECVAVIYLQLLCMHSGFAKSSFSKDCAQQFFIFTESWEKNKMKKDKECDGSICAQLKTDSIYFMRYFMFTQ